MGEAFKVKVAVFMPHTRNTSVNLKPGEHLFVLTDKGLEEAGHTGPQEVLIMTEHFGVWPVVAFGTSAPDEWRKTTPDDHRRMMARVRRRIAPSDTRRHLLEGADNAEG